MSDQEKKRIGDYEILDELGSGGMGRVYRVRNLISDRVEAMKVLLPDLAGRQELAARFLREIKLLASLNHPNIAALRTALTLDNQLVMIMEYVEGTTLASRLEHGPIATADALNYMDQVLDALSYAHKQNVIHRDIKPANMMLTPQGTVKLMDFGIARSGDDRTLTQAGTTMGSLSYMSPEQVKGEATDARSDLYSVGVSLYEMVTGQRPFQSGSDYSIMAAHVKETPRPPLELQPALPAALNEIILMAIAKDPGERFQSADAFRNALSQIRGVSSAARPAVSSTRGATMVDTAVPADFHNAPTATSRKQVSAPVPTMVDAKVTPIPNAPPPRLTPTNPPPRVTATPPPPPQTGHRGLYITLGAVIVLAVLVAAGIYIPRHNNTQANTTSTKLVTKPKNAVTEPKPTPPPPVAEKPTPAKTVIAKKAAAQGEGTTETKPAAASSKASELDDLEHQVDQLTARAGAVNSSLETLQRQQNAAGYGLRGDMSGRWASMKVNLQKAQSAVEHGDTDRAKRYIDLTESDVETLEHFLGR
jgi:serine/threonine-protein kinase